MKDTLGLIAGSGRFPIVFAEHVKRMGLTVTAIAHVGETHPELASLVSRIVWIHVGELDRMLTLLKQHGISQVVMAGGVRKTHLFTDARLDQRARELLGRLETMKDDLILRAMAGELEREGITVKASTEYLSALLAPKGRLAGCAPTEEEWGDVRFGWQVAKQIGQMDIGQCVVVKQRVVLAVEAVEGTDEAIRRGGRLAHGGAVAVKVCKPQQDMRFDLPTVGTRTIDALRNAGARVLAMEAEKTILLDKQETLKAAEEAGISILSLEEPV